MNDFAKTLEAKSDQVNNTDLVGSPLTIKITGVKVNTKEDQPVSISFEGSQKVYRPCKGMRRLTSAFWGVDPGSWVGRSMTLYRDPDVRFGSDVMGGIRISHMSHIDREKKMVIPVSRGKVKEYTVKPLTTAAPASEPDNALQLAETAARNGTEAFRAWWSSDEGKSCRVTAQANIDRLKQLAAEADGPSDDAPM